MIEIREIDDNRYCSSCGCDNNMYELVAKTDVYGHLEKSIPICKDCLLKMCKAIKDYFYISLDELSEDIIS